MQARGGVSVARLTVLTLILIKDSLLSTPWGSGGFCNAAHRAVILSPHCSSPALVHHRATELTRLWYFLEEMCRKMTKKESRWKGGKKKKGGEGRKRLYREESS